MENSSPQPDNDIKNGTEDASAEFKEKFKACDPVIKSVISEQKKAIRKLQKIVGKYEVEKQMLLDENKTLNKEVKVLRKAGGGAVLHLDMDLGDGKPPVK